MVTLVALRRQQSQQLVDLQSVDHTEAADRSSVGPEEGRQPAGDQLLASYVTRCGGDLLLLLTL